MMGWWLVVRRNRRKIKRRSGCSCKRKVVNYRRWVIARRLVF
jgi:hypothetical protein